ncbi:MAG: hypothetical protein J7K26_04015 [Candidatus Aenigmarchaeota archaeon]|nr:hypothetical protein [Candidatus Aenigmarchaeota archaeon]
MSSIVGELYRQIEEMQEKRKAAELRKLQEEAASYKSPWGPGMLEYA